MVFHRTRHILSVCRQTLRSKPLVFPGLVEQKITPPLALKIKITDELISSLKSKAISLSKATKEPVYIFDHTAYFTVPPFEYISEGDDRLLLKDGHYAYLSQTLQTVITDPRKLRTLTSFAGIHEDAIGFYVQYSLLPSIPRTISSKTSS